MRGDASAKGSRHGITRRAPATSAIRRRTAFVLRLIGFDDVVTAHLPMTGRGASVRLDRSDSFNLPDDARQRDRATGVILNVPADHLRSEAGPPA